MFSSRMSSIFAAFGNAVVKFPHAVFHAGAAEVVEAPDVVSAIDD